MVLSLTFLSVVLDPLFDIHNCYSASHRCCLCLSFCFMEVASRNIANNTSIVFTGSKRRTTIASHGMLDFTVYIQIFSSSVFCNLTRICLRSASELQGGSIESNVSSRLSLLPILPHCKLNFKFTLRLESKLQHMSSDISAFFHVPRSTNLNFSTSHHVSPSRI